MILDRVRCWLGDDSACGTRYDPETDERVRGLREARTKADREWSELREARLRGEPPPGSRSFLGNRIADRGDGS